MMRRRFGGDYLGEDREEKIREVEGELREIVGYPQRGKRWSSETTLYNLVDSMFPKKEVVHHYRGDELEGLEIDIWIPDLKVGLEYQGRQHYEPVEHWGGEEGLEERRERDRKKKNLCREHGYELVEFRYDEDFRADVLRGKLSSYLD